ncbi:MAG: AAA family ATPase [Candidatus Wallbacteria bacterium]|nr:AAA family ATPase [Candidatus Wallbacteria bacterium]
MAIKKPADRIGEIEFLLKKIAGTGCTVIVGMAGIGKSWLADALYRKIQDSGAKAIRLCCLENSTAQDLQAELSKSISVLTGRKQGDSNQNLETALQLLDAEQITLIMDDFHLIESRETLPVFGYATRLVSGRAVFFTRKRPELDAALAADIYQYNLQGLSEAETGAMTESLFSFHDADPPDQALKKAVFRHTAGHPFSVKIICGMLLTGRITVAELEAGKMISEFTDQYLDQSIWRQQPEEFRETLRILSILRKPVDREIVRSLAGDRAGTVIASLADSCLADTDMQGRIAVPQVVKNFVMRLTDEKALRSLHLKAAECLKKGLPGDPENLLETYYHYSSAAVRKRAVDTLLELAELNRYYQNNVRDVVHLLQKEMEGGRYRLQELNEALVEQLIILCRFEEAAAGLAAIVGSARHYLEGTLEYMRDNGARAIELFEKCRKRDLSPQRSLLLLLRMSMCRFFLGQQEKAEEELNAIAVLPELQDYPVLKAWFNYSRSQVEYFRGRTDKAISLIDECLEEFLRLGMRSSIPSALTGKAINLLSQNRIEETRAMARQILDIYGDCSTPHQRGMAFSMLAESGIRCGEYRDAIAWQLKAIECFKNAGLAVGMADEYGKLGNIWLRCGDETEALRNFQKSMELVEKNEEIASRVFNTCLYCELLIIQGKNAEAYERLHQVEASKGGRCPHYLTNFNFLLNLASRLSGREKEAEIYRARFMEDLEDFTPSTRETVEKNNAWLMQELEKRKGRINVLRETGLESMGKKDAENLAGKAGEYGILVDFRGKKLFVDGREVQFFHRQTMVKLLRELVRSPGRIMAPKEIFPLVWNRSYDPVGDEGFYRMTIARLRKILFPGNNERFIEKTGTSNHYRFNPACGYCIILPD